MASHDPALAWWLDLAPEQQRAVDGWLQENEPPEGTSGIQHAYDHREELDLPDNPEGDEG